MWILYSLLSLLVLFVVIGLLLPTTYNLARSVTIKAPRQRVHALLADLNEWPAWEPWREKDPTIQITLGPTTAGVGAHQAWADKNGGGELTFTRCEPDYGIAYDLLFAKKYACTAQMTHQANPDGTTQATWAMQGDTKTPVIGGYFARLMPLLIGSMFTTGLNNLKRAAESEAK